MMSKFVIDSNVFFNCKNNCYPFDIAPSFWQMIVSKIVSGEIILIDKVKGEIIVGNDELAEWVRGIPQQSIYVTSREEIFAGYQLIMCYLVECGYYKQAAIDEWAKENKADPWLIAVAMQEQATIITAEQSNGSLRSGGKPKEAKIPDVAQNFNVRMCSFLDMLRSLGVTIEFKAEP